MSQGVAKHRDRSDELRRYVETHHIDVIPREARHGKPWQQFAFWWGSNVNVFNVVLGAVLTSGYAIEGYAITFYWALMAIAVGTLAGGLLVALHATQGPKLGVPQTIQSRGQFGFYGSMFMFPAVLLLNIGFIAAILVIQAESLNAVVSSISIPWWIVIFTIPAVVVGIFGYRWIHRLMQATAVVVGIALIIMLIQGLAYSPLPSSESGLSHGPGVGLFLAGAALLVIDILSFGPFVSDYTRYLPADIDGKKLFWAIYSGNVLSTFLSCAVGAYLGALLPNAGAVGAVGKVSGDWALIIMGLSLINGVTINAYTGVFQVLAVINMWRRSLNASALIRVIPFVVITAVGVICALLGYKSFVANLSNFLDVLLLIFIPWSAVNLTDFFLVQHGRYQVGAFFNPDGAYGRFAWRGLVAYAIGLIVEWPFIDQLDYIGPLVKHLDGADISYIVGFFVSAAVYIVLVRVAPDRRPARIDEPIRASY